MKAWQFTGTGKPLEVNEVPEPVPGPGEVVLDVKAAGLCHSDVGVLDDAGWLELIPTLPVTMGHEVAGVISAVGPGVTGFAVGDRVGVCPTAGPITPGYSRDGGFAPKHRAPIGDLVPMPDSLSFELAALGTDAGMTAYHAMCVIGEVAQGMKTGVIGIGGLGQIGARIAVLKGAEVHVAEVNESIWDLARAIGATSVVHSIDELKNAGLDLVVDYAGFGTTTAGAIGAIRRNGRIVQVGMGVLEATISTRDLILRQAQLFGSNGGTKQDVADCYELFATGEVTPVITTIGFDSIPAGIDSLRAGTAKGRLVATW